MIEVEVRNWLKKDKGLKSKIIKGEKKSETEKAILLKGNDFEVWLPKSQIEIKSTKVKMEEKAKIGLDARKLKDGTIKKKGVAIKSPYKHKELCKKVKDKFGGKWKAKKEFWSYPLEVEVVDYAMEIWDKKDFPIEKSDLLKEWYEKRKIERENLLVNKDRKEVKPEELDTELADTLYDFQRVGVNFLTETKGAILGFDMGLGKTITSLATVGELKASPTLIVCPASLKYNWAEEIEKWLPNKTYTILDGSKKKRIEALENDVDFYITNYASLREKSRAKINGNWTKVDNELFLAINKKDFEVGIYDECFPKGTKIKTVNGDKNIEEIEKGEIVKNALGSGKVISKIKRKSDKIVNLKLSNGQEIKCTPNHPFFTDSGWVIAKKLKGEYIYKEKGINGLISGGEGYSKSKNDMPRVWGRIQSRKVSFQRGREKKILQHILLSEVENETTRNKKKDFYRGKKRKTFKITKRISQRKSRKSKKDIKKNERKQSYGKSRSKGKNEKYLKKQRSLSKNINRWKWKTYACSTKKIIKRARGRLDSRIPYKHKRNRWKKPWLPSMLQGRFSLSKKENMGRGRWDRSQLSKDKRERQKERKGPEKIRVERVEIQKQRNNGGFERSKEKDFVYNLEVSNHPSYYANGFLVHNCHRAKNRKSQQTKALYKITNDIKRNYLLTGTPIMNTPEDLWSLLHIIDRKKFSSFWRFVHRYCEVWDNGFGKEIGKAKNPKDFREMLKPYMLRRLKEEVIEDMPELTIQKREVELEGKQRKIYEQMRDRMVAEIGEQEKVTAPIVISKIMRLKQIAVSPALISDKDKEFKSAKIDTLMEIISDSGKQKVVVFTQYQGAAELVADKLDKKGIGYGLLHGGIDEDKRQEDVNRFQNNDNCEVFIATIKAGGLGINLTAGSIAVFLDKDWTDANNKQAIDRLHRIGQERNVTVIELIAKDTIEQYIEKLLKEKQKTFDSLIEGEITPKEILLNLK
mgnify:CR=1 FL=1